MGNYRYEVVAMVTVPIRYLTKLETEAERCFGMPQQLSL